MINLEIDIPSQQLFVFDDGKKIRDYLISSAKNGVGEEYGSMQTPRGLHVIRAKIGGGCAPNTVFVKRRPTGEFYTPDLRVEFPERDWVVTRILWLSGLEINKNRFGNVDSMKRKVYIHGSPDDVVMGIPGSHGCIRMRNQDVIDLFDIVPVGTRLMINE